MLTVDDIVKLYMEGVEIVHLKKHPEGLKSEWGDSSLMIFVYEENLESKKDYYLSILHEMIHARDEIIKEIFPLIGRDEYSCTNFEEVEKETFETYKKAPYVLQFIKELYDIK